MASNGNGRRRSRYLQHRRQRRHANSNGQSMPRWVIALLGFAGLMIILASVVAGVGYGLYQSYADDLIPPEEAIAKQARGGARIYDREGRLLYQFVDDISGINEPIPGDEMSLWLPLATIATEDASFLDNPGVNYRGIAAAAWDNFSPFGGTPGFLEGRGGSSITQQLVKNVYFTPEERTERSLTRKLKETVLALELTEQYSKKQILEWYLNLISYGNIYNGVEAASQGYFGKSAAELTLWEAATLAGIPASPSEYDPLNNPDAVVARRNYVLGRMYEEGYLGKKGSEGARITLWDAASRPLEVKAQQFPIEAPHYVFNVVQPEIERIFGSEALNRDGLVVYTTLDLDWQKRAEVILEEWITAFEVSGGHNGAAVGIDPKTAEVLVYVGSRNYFDEGILGQNDMANAVNSPGSAFKPITYVTTFMNLNWGPGTLILDEPIPGAYWDGERPPRNPIAHSGPISARDALGNSLNIPAIKAILHAGVDNVVEQAKRMGITTLDGRDLGPSMTVGGVDVKLSDMVYAFTAFPNLGLLKGVESSTDRQPGNRAVDPVSILRVEDRDGNVLYPKVDNQPAEKPVVQEVRVAPAQEAFLISDILSDPRAQCLTFTCGGLSMPGRPLAVKTGTSEPYERAGLIGDTWAIGYTPQMVFGSWFGNADNAPMTGISSTSVSWRTVRDFMIEFHADLPVEEFQRPEGLVRASVCVPSGLRPTQSCPQKTPEDWFPARILEQKEDDWWRMARIDTRTGKLASELTPPAFVANRFALQVPASLTGFARDDALAWASRLGISGGQLPTETTQESDIPAFITSPANGAQVQGTISITGRASSANFVSYRLEFEGGPDGSAVIAESSSPVQDGALGVWDTSALTPGVYTLRLVVIDSERGEIVYRTQVVVVAPGELPEDGPGDAVQPGEGGGRGRGGPNRGPG